jgi:signal transduction histidine kinase/ligand-binding sensor domain-containing protein
LLCFGTLVNLAAVSPESHEPRRHGRVGGWRRRLAVSALWLSTSWVLVAAERDPFSLFFETWQTENGLPQNHGTAIVQTRDGYLWFGTYNGLVRFDGVRFAIFNAANSPGLASSRITSLYEDSDGALWLGHDAGELTCLRAGRFAGVATGGRSPGRSVIAIARDSRNELWLLHDNGLLLRASDGITIPPEPGSAAPSLVRDSTGTLWRVHGGRMRSVGEPGATPRRAHPPEDDFIVRACAGRQGGFWLACGERVRRWDAGAPITDWGKVPWSGDSVTAMQESRDGRLWVGTLAKGLFVLLPDGRHARFNRTNGLAHDWVRSLGEDHEGTIWIGTGGGICAARQRQVSMLESPDHWQGRSLLSLSAAVDGAMWMGTEGAGVYRWHHGQWTRFGEREGLTNLFVWSILEDSRQQIWAGTWGGGLFQLVDGRFVHPPALAGERVPICALFPGRDGALWAGTQRGLLRLKDDRIERFAGELSRPEVRTIAEARDGAIWFGMSGGGLGRLQAGQTTQFRRADGLPSDYVWSLLAEEDGTLWIGTFGGGLCRWRNGHFAAIGSGQGLPNNVIGHLTDDRRGHLWMGSYGGILRASKDELNRCADGHLRTVSFVGYGKTDGLASLECAEGLQPGGCRTPDGRLWFPTSKGLAVLDPASLRTNALAPPVMIEEVVIDGVSGSTEFAPTNGTRQGTAPAIPLRIPPGRQRLEIRFTALSFVAPERVRFQYRLEGLESDWAETTTKRSVDYSFLPPGEYNFHVMACNSDGVWNRTGATLAITKVPYFWQTWGFLIAAVLTAAGAVGGTVRAITRQRYRRRLERLERQRAIEKERTRIAKDIHDDLGASLTRITLLSQTARAEVEHPGPAATDLDQIYTTARELTQAMDEIVWAVDPHHDTLDSLVIYLGGFAQDFLSAAGIRCRLEGPLMLPPWPVTAEVRHNLFLAFKEAVHNVVRHSAATEAGIQFTLASSGFTLDIQDDGRGFDPSSPRGARTGDGERPRATFGHGLINMRKRLEEIGGQCSVESGAGRGTRVRFALPMKSNP